MIIMPRPLACQLTLGHKLLSVESAENIKAEKANNWCILRCSDLHYYLFVDSCPKTLSPKTSEAQFQQSP